LRPGGKIFIGCLPTWSGDGLPAKIVKKAERFSEKKLRASLKKVRALPKATKAAVDSVKKKVNSGAKAVSTVDIRKTVVSVLRKLDPGALKKYMGFKKKK
jgi:transcriptional regulator NrdR family protein